MTIECAITSAATEAEIAREAARTAKREQRNAQAILLRNKLTELQDRYAVALGQCQDGTLSDAARKLYAASAVFESHAPRPHIGIGWAVDTVRLAVKMLGMP